MKYLTVNPDAIPAQMRSLPHWFHWRGEPGKNGKDDKKPYQVGNKWHASSTKSKTWTTFERAVAAMSNGFSRDGLGFAFQDSGIVFVDLDHVRDLTTGVIAPWASEVITTLDSYSEISPSGDGVHIYAFGVLPGDALPVKFADGTSMEMYDAGRYATVTGHPIAGVPSDLKTCDAQVKDLYQRLASGKLRLEPVVPLESAEPALETSPAKPASTAPPLTPGSICDLLDKFGLAIKTTEEYQGTNETGVKFVLDACPFNPEHRDPAVFDYPSGAVFHCFHDSCADNTWRHLCSKFEYQAPGDFSWRQQIIVSEGGNPKALLANAVLMLRHHPDWQGVLGFNEFSLYTVAIKPAPWPQSTTGKNWGDDDDARAACWLQQHKILVGSKVAAEAAQTIARENVFHPVRDYLNGLVWDGKERIPNWLATYLGAEPTPLASAIGQRWLVSAVARIMAPGCKADHTLLLEGVQGAGKSTALQVLASPPWFTDHLSDLGSKDSRLELHGRWIVELAEFVSRRSELERKAFLTATADCFRAPYERRTQWVPRSNVFAATTNDATPLTDESGSRRYWPVTCGRIDLDRLRDDRHQLWAEAFSAYKDGEPWWDDFDEFRAALAEEQESRYQGGPNDDLILEWCERPVQRQEWANGAQTPIEPFDSDRMQVTITDVLLHALGKRRDALNRQDQLAVRACLVHAGWRRGKQTKIRGTNRVTKFYLRPLKLKKLGEE